MCIELPGTVVALDGEMATIRYRNRTVSASTLTRFCERSMSAPSESLPAVVMITAYV